MTPGSPVPVGGRRHSARPDGDYERPGGEVRCAACAAPVIEAVYGGGWMHAAAVPHAFLAFVYADGKRQEGGGCLLCGKPDGDALHAAR
jgi:hypothetical protein